MTAQVRHPLFARFYSRLASGMEHRGLGDLRDRLLTGLSGVVVEVGAGDGANFAHYPPAVTRVVAVEPEGYLRGRAAARASDDRFDVVDGVAGRLDLADDSADAVVFCLVLCSVPDVAAALAEAHRVLRPGGELRVLEHVAADGGKPLARVQRALDATVWPRLFGGCHTGRDTVAAIEGGGFRFTSLERFRFPESSVAPVAPHVLGRAVRGG